MFNYSQLDSIDETQIEQLERIIGVWFDLYPKLWPRQRFGYNRCLARLFGSLYTKGPVLKILISKIGKIITCQNFLFLQPSHHTLQSNYLLYTHSLSRINFDLLNVRRRNNCEWIASNRARLSTQNFL